MKTSQIWIDLITHDRKRKWQWLPSFIRSNFIYDSGGKTYLAPLWELVWLCFVFHWKAYSRKKVYSENPSNYHECPAELTQARVNQLENAIRKHRSRLNYYSENERQYADRILWRVLGDSLDGNE
jgi:hypothetical protein